MKAKMHKTPRVKAATAFSNRNSIFRIKVWDIRQNAQTANNIVASYSNMSYKGLCSITYSKESDMSDFILRVQFKDIHIVDLILLQDFHDYPCGSKCKDKHKEESEGVHR
jgi:hypothetical protein